MDEEYRIDQKAAVEFIGTFFLTLVFGCSTLLNPSSSALATGMVLVALVYGGGPISGGNYNPVVSLAFLVNGCLTFFDALVYSTAQFCGAITAAFAVELITGKLATPESIPIVQVFSTLLAEFLFAFALVYVVLSVSTQRYGTENHYYGLATGFMAMAGALAVGNNSRGIFNPAVNIAAGIMGLSNISTLWVPVLADYAGGLLAALVHIYLVERKEFEATEMVKTEFQDAVIVTEVQKDTQEGFRKRCISTTI